MNNIPSYVGYPTHPDNDGKTLLLGGFPRDTARDEIQQFLNAHVNIMSGVESSEPKYRLGSTALIHFREPRAMWNMMREKPNLQLNDNRLWTTLPKSEEERDRDSHLTSMAKAVEHHHQGTRPIINWRMASILVNNIPVARLAVNGAGMEVSASRLTMAGVGVTAVALWEKYEEIRKSKNGAAVLEARDWR